MHTEKKDLTNRQKEILALLRKGLTNHDICRILCISPNTVKVHLTNIYKVLEVTNRTEAAFTNELDLIDFTPPEENLVDISIHSNNDLTIFPKANATYISIIEALHRYHLFRIHENEARSQASGYKIDFSAASNNSEALFITLKEAHSPEILWTRALNIHNDNLQFIANQTAAQLFHQMSFTTAVKNHTPQSSLPYWWYISCYTKVKAESCCKEVFNICEAKLKPIAMGKQYNNYAAYQLAFIYYLSILDANEKAPYYTEKLGEITRRSMRDYPYSIYSLLMMALYNIVIGNKREASSYLLDALNKNPYDTTARTLLPQIYLLTGQDDKAIAAINENKKLLPDYDRNQHLYSRAFICFLQDDFKECKDIASQILLFRPESLYARILITACWKKAGNMEECRKHIHKLFEYNPKFNQVEIEKLLSDISPNRKNIFADLIQFIFQIAKKTS